MGIRDEQVRGPSPRLTSRGRPTVSPVISRIVSSLMVILVVSSGRRHAVVSLRGGWRSGWVTIPWSLMVISRTPVDVHARGVPIISRRGSRRRRYGSSSHPRRQWRRVVASTPSRAIRVRLPRSVGRIIFTRSIRPRSKVFSLPFNRRPRGIPGDRHWTRTPRSDSRRIPRRIVRDTAVRTRGNRDRWLRVDCRRVQITPRGVATFDRSGRVPLR